METKFKFLIVLFLFASLHFILDANDIKYYTYPGIYLGKIQPEFYPLKNLFDPLENNTILNEFSNFLKDSLGQLSNTSAASPGNETCRPFTDIKQFSITLDNQVYPRRTQLFRNSSINFKCLNLDTSKKIILFWNTFFGEKYYFLDKGLKDGGCPVTNCELTDDKNKLNDASLVITHMYNSIMPLGLNVTRPSFQRWVFMLYESPFYAGFMKIFNNFYNMTSTYKVDSDFSHFYENAQLVWKKNPQFNKNFNFYSEKKHFAAAVISNCRDFANRMNYTNKIANFISIDVFGKCGKPCPKAFSNGTASNDCKAILGQEYKFYFAFENSICEDYITEKFHDILSYNTIPVVRGGGNYQYYVSPECLRNYFKSVQFRS